MDFNRNWTGAVVNPYVELPAAAESESNDSPNIVAITSVVRDLNMRNQSQLRNSAVKKCKKMGTKRKTSRVYKTNAI